MRNYEPLRHVQGNAIDPESGPRSGYAQRLRLARQLRAIRWGVLLVGTAATVAFSTLAMHGTSQADSGQATSAPPAQLVASDMPSQSLFTDGLNGFSLSPDSLRVGGQIITQPHARSSTS
ncbi:hypothetical protein [Sphaerobacter sp.]|uniref:hypothetical protein n=1 Tax=Sphaerobacter sp. TaxID=2099654 RepID=UPI001D6E923C|nr:hypothetical protein [Sphaerobacter sp.]MBX5446336.1 hypothetical protein [Sphaerobacter sp.]